MIFDRSVRAERKTSNLYIVALGHISIWFAATQCDIKYYSISRFQFALSLCGPHYDRNELRSNGFIFFFYFAVNQRLVLPQQQNKSTRCLVITLMNISIFIWIHAARLPLAEWECRHAKFIAQFIISSNGEMSLWMNGWVKNQQCVRRRRRRRRHTKNERTLWPARSTGTSFS